MSAEQQDEDETQGSEGAWLRGSQLTRRRETRGCQAAAAPWAARTEAREPAGLSQGAAAV